MRVDLPESFKMKTRVCLYWLCSSISLASSSPSMMSPIGPSDWSVPHASRLKYRQQFNGLDKHMTGYLTGMICLH